VVAVVDMGTRRKMTRRQIDSAQVEHPDGEAAAPIRRTKDKASVSVTLKCFEDKAG